MTASHQLVYFIFAIVLVLALILDLGLLSKKDNHNNQAGATSNLILGGTRYLFFCICLGRGRAKNRAGIS